MFDEKRDFDLNKIIKTIPFLVSFVMIINRQTAKMERKQIIASIFDRLERPEKGIIIIFCFIKTHHLPMKEEKGREREMKKR